MTIYDREQIRLGLVKILEETPRGYGEGKLMSHGDANRIADKLVAIYFLVDRSEVPLTFVNDKLECPREEYNHMGIGPITEQDRPEYWYWNILASFANYNASVEIQQLREEKEKQNQKDIDLAFSLLKVADPYNLKYVKWDHVPRSTQDAFLNVARKAREELAEK